MFAAMPNAFDFVRKSKYSTCKPHRRTCVAAVPSVVRDAIGSGSLVEMVGVDSAMEAIRAAHKFVPIDLWSASELRMSSMPAVNTPFSDSVCRVRFVC